MLKKMTEVWLDILAEYGWETPVTELTWCSTIQDDNRAQFEIRGLPALRTSAAEGFKVLRTILTFDNKYDQEIEHRLSRANAAFYASWHLLGCVTSLQSGGGRVDLLVCRLLEPDQGAQ